MNCCGCSTSTDALNSSPSRQMLNCGCSTCRLNISSEEIVVGVDSFQGGSRLPKFVKAGLSSHSCSTKLYSPQGGRLDNLGVWYACFHEVWLQNVDRCWTHGCRCWTHHHLDRKLPDIHEYMSKWKWLSVTCTPSLTTARAVYWEVLRGACGTRS